MKRNAIRTIQRINSVNAVLLLIFGLAGLWLCAPPAFAVVALSNAFPNMDLKIGSDGSDGTEDASEHFSSSEGIPLSYKASSSNPSVAEASSTGSTITITRKAVGQATITVSAKEQSGISSWVNATFNVKVRPDNSPPDFTSSASVNVAENSTTVITVVASDYDSQDSVTGYSFSASADQAKFSIDSSSGALTFKTAPDYENPGSAATPASNTYEVAVQATSGEGGRDQSATQTITVKVTNVNEAPTTVGSISAVTISVDGDDESVDVSSNFSDPDANTTLTYTASSSDTAKATVSVASSTVTISPEAAGSAKITVTASDGSLTASKTFTVTVKANTAPTFTTLASVTAPENQTAVITVKASDDESEDTIGDFSISGGDDEDEFSITAGGVLTFDDAPDFEAKGSADDSNDYEVIVKVKSGTGDREKEATQTITVTVTDVNETPKAKDSISDVTISVDGNDEDVDVSSKFEDPDDDTLTYTVSSSDTAKATVSVSSSTVTISPEAAGTATITVTASDGSLSATQDISVTVKANTAPTFTSSARVDVKENTTTVVTVTATDSETEDTIGDYSIKTTTGSGADHGKFSVTTGGILTFSSAPDFETPDSAANPKSNVYKVTVEAQSGSGDRNKKATQDITVTVTNVNETPEAVGAISAVTLNVGGSDGLVDVSSKFSDPDGDDLTYTVSSDKTSVATATRSAVKDHVIVIKPVSAGSATVTVTAGDRGLNDDARLIATQTISVTVKANTAPTFSSSASVEVAENTTTVVTVTAADSESEDTIGDYSIKSGADKDKFSILASTGALSFSSAPNFEDPDSDADSNVYKVTVEVKSGTGDREKKATQDITVTVTNVNETPVAKDTISAVTLNQDGNSDSVDVSSKFSDPDANDTLTYTASSSKESVATVSVENSIVTIKPKAGGAATITVTATDSGSETATQTISVTVNANTAPTFSSSAIKDVAENNTAVITVSASDSDSGDSVTGYTISGGADSGKFSIGSSSGDLSFKTKPDYETPGSAANPASNTYKVTVQASSGSGDRVRTADQTITVTVTDVNETPEKVGSISAVTLNQDGNTDAVDVSSKFSDPDGDTLSYTAASDKASVATAAVSSSTVTITPKAAGKATVTVTASDDGDLSVKQMFIVTVKANADPTFSSSASVKVAENTTTVVTVTATDSESEDDIGDYSIKTVTGSGADHGKFSITTGGALTFSSAPDFEDPDSDADSNEYKVTVEVESGADDRMRTATQDITVTVTDVNETPEAVDTISAVTLNQDGNSDSVDVSSKFSDPDAGDTLTYTASSSDTAKAEASVSDSTVTITPKAAGTATITVTATDSGSETATQDISVTVKKNTAPAFTSKANVDVAENSTSVVKVVATDSESEDNVTGYSITDGADKAKFSIDSSSGALSFRSAPNFESPDSSNSSNVYAVTVQVSSGSGDRVRTATQTLKVTVTDVNETPEAVGKIPAVTLNELGDSDSVDVSSAFTDPDSNTTLTYTASSGDSSVATATVSSSTVTITPAADGTATITVTASDGSLKAAQDISVTVKENTAPTFGNSARVSVSENTTAVVTLTAADSENEDAIGDYSITSGADQGKFSIVASTGALSFSSAPNYESPGSAKGSNVYAVTVGVSSGDGDRVRTATQNLTVTVTDVNETPEPIGEVSGSTVNQDGNSSQVDVASNFSDPDRDTLRYSALSSAASVATASASGSTVTIAPVAPGNATITVTASDGSLSTTQDISVTVKPNSAPTFGSSSSVSVPENSTSVIAVSASDREDGINGYSISGGADSAKFSIGSSSGDLSFSSAPNYENPGSANGTNVYAVTVRVSSGSGDRLKSAAQDISITVTDVNETPEAVGSISEVTLNEDGNSDSVDASSYFADPDGDTLSYTASSSATSVATASASGSTVTIAPVAAGGAIVTVTASDGGLSATQTFVVTVLANTGPAFGSSANLSVPENTTAVITLTAIDSEDSINGYSISGGADSGQFTINTSSGVLSFNTAPNYESPADASGNNNYIVEVQASSGGGDRVKTATQTLTVPVTDVNETPEAVGTISGVALNEDGNSGSVDVLSKFSDPDGDTLSYTASSSAASVASASVSGSTVTIAPVSAGTATVTVTASDPGNLNATQTIAVTVLANGAPTFGSSANLSVPENTTAVITLTAIDSEDSINGYSISGGADSGQFTINTSSGVLSFNTAPNYESPADASGNNDYIVEVQVSSGGGDRVKTATQTLTVPVTDVNEAPEASGSVSSVTLNVDGNSHSVDVSGNFTDPDGDTLSYTASSSAASVASASVSGSSITIAPVAAGNATVTVTAADPDGLDATQTISVTVKANTAPTFNSPASVSVAENTTTVITVSASDSEDSINGYSISGGADSGQFSIDGSSGVLSFNTAPNYESPADASGTNDYIVDVQASSGGGDRVKTATQTLTVTVTDVNEAPEAVGAISAVTVNEDGNSDSVDASSNFSDPDGDTLSYTASSSAASVATASVSGSTITISPVAAGSATVTVTASDPGNLSATQTISVTVKANTAPAFGSSANLSVPENTTAVITLTATDSEDSINGYSISGGADSAKFSINTSSGVLSFNTPPNYESPADASGNNDYIVEVQVSSGGGDRVKTATQTLTVTVTDVNEAPEAVGTISGVALNVDGNSRSVDVASYFTDPDGDTLRYTASSSAASVATTSASGSSITIAPVSAGTATITVTAADPDGLDATQTISVTVKANTAPTFNSPASVSVAENTINVISVSASDSEDSINGYSISGGADSAKFSINTSSGALSFNTPPNYESPADASGNNDYIVEVQASSGGGDRAKTATQTLTVTVTDVNEAPLSTGSVSAITLNVDGVAWLKDVSGDFTDPDGDTLSFAASSSQTAIAAVSVSGSTVTVAPVAAGNAAVTVTATDPGGLSATQTIGVEVKANDSSQFIGVTAFSVPENTLTVGTVTATDNDDTITGYSISGGADSGKFSIVASSGALSFNLAPNFENPGSSNGTNDYEVIVGVESGAGDRAKTATQSLTVTVTDVNEAPEAVGAISGVTLNVDGNSRTVDVAANFTDPDGDALTYTASTGKISVASASVSGSIVRLTPVAAGSATVTVTANDGSLSAVQTIAVTVIANSAPTFNSAANFAIPENTIAVGTVTAADNDSGDTITGYTIAGGADSGQFTINTSSGVLSFSSAPNYESPADASGNNDYIVEMQVSSGGGDRAKTATQTITVTVTDVNEAPQASGSISNVTLNVDGNSRSVDVSGNFTDPDGDALRYTASSSAPSVATASASGSSVTIAPVTAGSATVTVAASDPDGLSAGQTIAVTVMANSAPAFSSATSFSVPENTIAVGTVTAADNDSGDTITGYSIAGGADGGKFSIDGSSGVLSFNTAPNYEAPTDASGNNDYIVEVQASSGSGDRAKTATQTLTVTVTDVNEAPIAAGSVSAIVLNAGGNAAVIDVSGNFTDPDGDALTYSASSSTPTVATAAMSNDALTVSPLVAGATTVTVRATDPGGLSATQTISVTVKPNDSSRFIGVTAFSVPENTTSVGTVTAADNDSGDKINGYSIAGGADSKQFSIDSSSGALRFNTAPNYEAPTDASGNNDYIVEVQVSSGSGDRAKTATQPLTVTVIDVNEAPLATGSISSVTLNAGGNAAVIDVSGNFTDPDGDALTYSASSSKPSAAGASVSGSTVTVTPLTAGSATVTVTASDPDGLSAGQTIAVIVNPNRLPTFSAPFSFSVPENTTAVGTVTAADSDSGDSVTGYAITGGADDANFSIDSASGALSFKSPPNYEAPADASGNNDYIIEVQASSGSGDRAKTASQTFTVTVTDVNEAPLAIGAIPGVSVNVGGNPRSVDAASYFTDPDGDTLSYTASSNKTGAATVSVSGSTVTISPVAAGRATVTVTASDPDGLRATQTIAVTVVPAVNQPPAVQKPIAAVTLEDSDSSVTVDVSDNFADPDGGDLTYTAVSSDTGVVTVSATGDAITIASAGEGAATITVTATDSHGLEAAQTFAVTVTPAPNAPPVVTEQIAAITLVMGQPSKTVDVSGNFSDPEGETLTYTAVSSDTAVVTVSVTAGEITVSPQSVESAALVVTASDGELTVAQTVQVKVEPAPNRAPVAAKRIDSIAMRDGETPATVDLSEKFSDADGDSLTYTVVSSDTDVATAVVSGDTLTITLVGVGETTITVTATDANGLTTTQTFTVTVEPPPNRSPVVKDTIGSVTLQDGEASKTVDLSEKFSDADGDNLTYTAVSSDPDVATVSVSEGTLTITPVAVGATTVTVSATDADGLTTTQTFTVTVEPPPNRSPVVKDTIGSVTLQVGGASETVDLTAKFSDPDGDDLTYTAVSSDTDAATAVVSGNTLTIAPAAVGAATATVTASDADGLTAAQTFTITVEPPPNRSPVVEDPIGSVTLQVGGASKTVDLTAKFSDPDGDDLTYTAVSSDTDAATAVVSGDTLTIAPAAVRATTITVTATDADGLTAAQTFTVTVEEPPNQAPLFAGAVSPITLDAKRPSVTLNGANHFSDPDGDHLSFTATSSDSGAATVSVSGDLITVASQGPGATTVTVTATDSKGLTAAIEINVTVLASNVIQYRTELLPNYPSPFNPETWIPYRLGEDGDVTLTVYDANGRAVRTFAIGYQDAGEYVSRDKAVHWDGRNNIGEPVAAGVYFFHLATANYSGARETSIIK